MKLTITVEGQIGLYLSRVAEHCDDIQKSLKVANERLEGLTAKEADEKFSASWRQIKELEEQLEELAHYLGESITKSI